MDCKEFVVLPSEVALKDPRNVRRAYEKAVRVLVGTLTGWYWSAHSEGITGVSCDALAYRGVFDNHAGGERTARPRAWVFASFILASLDSGTFCIYSTLRPTIRGPTDKVW